MAKNANLNKAKDAKVDEFYTRREDIEAELSHYRSHFKDKVVYCNCDDPTWSEFWQFFVRVFKDWGLKKLMATHYEPDEKNFAYKLEIYEDTNGDGKIDLRDEPTITQIQCNGDFRSQICIDLLKEADIVVTNPPFSLFRNYVAQLVEYEKKFLIIGPMGSITYKEIFPLLRDGKMWIGYTFPKIFRVPDGTVGASVYVEKGVTYQKFGNIQWFTNLDIPKRHVSLDLRGNYYSGKKYPKYVNYDGIEVKNINDIPCDYAGAMGVPVSFLSDFNPEQFELIGTSLELAIPMRQLYKKGTYSPGGNRFYTNALSESDIKNGYKYHRGYDRIAIKLKNPEPRRYPDDN